MEFDLINIDKWKNASRYKYFFNDCRCTFSMTTNIDVTKFVLSIKNKCMKFYPCYVYIVSKIVNMYDEYRMGFNNKNELGVWKNLNPCFPNFHDDDKTISMLWLKYKSNFDEFYNDFINEREKYKFKHGYFVQNDMPQNIFQVSCIPWTEFTALNFQMFNTGLYFFPIVVCGKYFKKDNKILLPVSVQLHHAVCDGYHMCRFFDELQNGMNEL